MNARSVRHGAWLRVLGGVAVPLGMAAPAVAPVGAQADMSTLNCEGPFAKTATHADVEKAFGKENVRIDDIDGAEGEVLTGTIVFPDDPNKRLEIVWQDEGLRDPIVKIAGQSGWTIAGIKLGTAMAEIEKMNGKPFRLYGFDWDYGGTSFDWEGGALAKPLPGGCVLSVRFGRADDVSYDAANKASGDTDFLSDHPDIVAVSPVVSEIGLSYAAE